jgi:hypothetical protein
MLNDFAAELSLALENPLEVQVTLNQHPNLPPPPTTNQNHTPFSSSFFISQINK